MRLIVKAEPSKITVVRRVKDPTTGAVREVQIKPRGGPFIGPRGGKWADATHTIPWQEAKVVTRPAKPVRTPEHERKLAYQRFQRHIDAAGWQISSSGPGYQAYQSTDRTRSLRLDKTADGRWQLSGDASGEFTTTAQARTAILEAMKAEPPAVEPPTSPSRKELQQRGFKVHAKSSDLFGFGYSVAEWFSPRQLADVKAGKRDKLEIYYEYIPRRPGLQRYIATTYEEQVQVHNKIGAPVKPPSGPAAMQEDMFGPPPEAGPPRARGERAITQEQVDVQQRRRRAEVAEPQLALPGVAPPSEPGWERMPELPKEPGAKVIPAPVSEFELPPSTFGPPVKVKTTPGTRVKWAGLSGWMNAWDTLAERASHHPSTQKYVNRREHAATDLTEEISDETDVGLLKELQTKLKTVKREYGGPADAKTRGVIAANEVLINNRIAELERTTPKLSHEERRARWLATQEPRLTVPAKPSEPGWERMPEAEARAPRLTVPTGERTEAVEAAMAAKKSKAKRKSDNELAVEIVQKALAEGRGLTDAEAVRVAAYSGKGGISGDLNQYYTKTEIAQSMWDVMAAYTDRLENVLEPACGSGVFLQTAPKGSKVTGVELDSTAATIAEVLHGSKHEVHSQSLEEFSIERYGTPQNFDAVITNAPFCTRSGEGIPKHKPEFTSADRYFLDTALDHVKDGGLVTMIVHSSVMNSHGPAAREFRERILARAEVLDGFRLPKEAFDHTHTEVVSDVLVLRKRDSRVGAALERMSRRGEGIDSVMTALGAWDQALVDGDYFEQHPDRVLGKALSADETGWRSTVTGDASKIPGALRRLTEAKIGQKPDPAAKPVTFDALVELGKENEVLKDNLGWAQTELKKSEVPPVVGNVQVISGARYLYIGEPPLWKLMETIDDVSQIINKSGDKAIKDAHEIALDLEALIQARDAGEFYKSRSLRRAASDRVKAWVAENGIPGSHRALVELAKSAPKLLDFIACVDSNGELSDVLSKDAAVTLKPAEVDRSNLMSVADYIARRNRGYVTTEDLQHNWEGWEGQSEDELHKALVGTGQYALTEVGLQQVEDYLTGNLYDKLDSETARLEAAESADRPQIQRQIDLLRGRIETKRRSIDDVPIQLRVLGWMPLDYLNRYLNSPEGRRTAFNMGPVQPGELEARIVYDRGIHTLQWVAPAGGYKRSVRYRTPEGYVRTKEVTSEPGTVIQKTSDGYDFLKYMNRLSLRRERVEDVEQHLENGFSEWIKASELRTELENLYNRTFNAEFRREYSGDPLGLEGMTEGIVPHDFQNQAVRWAAETGRGILGQDVGLGKTFIAILLARLRKQQGLARRPFVVVPKSVATNWAEEVETLFPGSRVLVIGEHKTKAGGTQSDTDMERNRKLAMVKQNEYDLIICTKPAFDRIPLRHETIERYEQDDFWYQRAGRVDQIQSGSKTQETADKRIEKLKAAWAQDKLQQKFQHKESLIFWEDLGIDTMIADEAHAYKNLYTARSRFGKNPKFLGGSGQSKQARKMQHMSRFVRDANPNNGVYLMTATPTKNSPLEVFNMLQHVAPEAFRDIGIENSEQFIDRFCQLESRLVLTPPGRKKDKPGEDEDETQYADEFEGAGNLESAICVTGFTNLKELEQIMDRYMMLQTATDVGLKIPDADDQTHLVEMTDEQKAVYQNLRQDAIELDKDEDPGGMFRIMDRMKKAAQDLELYDPEVFKDWYRNSPKYKACVEEAYKGAVERGGQIIFCDHNASHERIKQMLVEKGLKPTDIGIINANVAADSAERQRIGNQFNRGEIKVVIGNTGTMGEGVNLQGKKNPRGTTDIHHLDQPWDPGTMHQRNGRGVRQGNRAEQVAVHTYLSTGSFDGFRHSTLKGKERWLDKLRSGADNISNDMEGQGVDEIEMLAMLSDNPDAALEAIKSRKASAESAWYAKQAQESIDTFYKYQRRLERLGKLQGQPEAAQSLATETERIKRQLLRNELLPLEIKEDLKSGDTRPAAVNTYMTGEGDTARLAARVIRAGDVVESKGTKYVVTGINLTDRKIMMRQWGYEHVSGSPGGIDVDKIAAPGYKLTDYKAVDELKEALKNNADTSYNTPIEAVNHIAPDVLEANQGMIDEAMRAWHAKHGEKDTRVIVRAAGGIQEVLASELEGKEIVYPWGADRAELVEAIAAANTGGTTWDGWSNPLIQAGRAEYGGYSSYRPGLFSKVVKDAEQAWKRRAAA